MQTVSLENLYEMSDPIFEEKNQKKKKKTVCSLVHWISP